MKLTNEQLIELIKEQIEEVFGRPEAVDSELKGMSLQQLKNKKTGLIRDKKTDTIVYKKIEKLIKQKQGE